MAWDTDLFTSLTGDSALAALIGTRLYPDEAPQDVAVPFIVYYEFANPRDQNMSCEIVVSSPRVQYRIYADTYAQGKAVAAALRDALVASGNMVIFEDERGGNDVTTGLKRRDIDARITHVGA